MECLTGKEVKKRKVKSEALSGRLAVCLLSSANG